MYFSRDLPVFLYLILQWRSVSVFELDASWLYCLFFGCKPCQQYATLVQGTQKAATSQTGETSWLQFTDISVCWTLRSFVVEYWGLNFFLLSFLASVTCPQAVQVYFIIIIFVLFFQLYLFGVIANMFPGNTWSSCCQLWKAFPRNSDHQTVAAASLKGLLECALHHTVVQHSITMKHLHFVSVICYCVRQELLVYIPLKAIRYINQAVTTVVLVWNCVVFPREGSGYCSPGEGIGIVPRGGNNILFLGEGIMYCS